MEIKKWARGPQWWAEGPSLIFQTVQSFCVVKKMKVAQEGILSWFIVLGGSKLGRRPTVVGWRPTTDLLNNAQFGCSEENESCWGGYPELIYGVGGWICFPLHMLACMHGGRLVTCSTDVWTTHPSPHRDKDFGHISSTNSSFLKYWTVYQYVSICEWKIIFLLLIEIPLNTEQFILNISSFERVK